MRRFVLSSSLSLGALACGGVHDGFPDQWPQHARPEVKTDELISVRFPDPPDDLPRAHLRAALVWTDHQSEQPGGADVAKGSASVRSDTQVEYSNSLAFELPVTAPEPYVHYDYASHPLKTKLHETPFYSLPAAEVVLYHDANHNGMLDLLPAGETGPGPDRILALSSGHDRQNSARRTLIVHKRSPLSRAINALDSSPSLESFWLPQPEGTYWAGMDAPFPEDGLYSITLSIGANDKLAQQALLSGYSLPSPGPYARTDLGYLQYAFAEVQRAQEASVRLYRVDPQHAQWLARGCQPWFVQHDSLKTPLPPPGAAIQCGVDQLLYATSPENYCGQVAGLHKIEWEMQTDEPWPCGPRGLTEGTPYHVSTVRLDGDPLIASSRTALHGTELFDPPPDFRCEPGAIYDFDLAPDWQFPSVAPAPGSQVKCYGHESLSFIPPRADGCNFKYSYQLTSESWAAAYSGNFINGWDLRAEPPEWWPCDEGGELRGDASYEPPHELAGECSGVEYQTVEYHFPPPPNTEVHCASEGGYRYKPLWADACDGRLTVSFSGHTRHMDEDLVWTGGHPDDFPCDTEGHFKPRPGLSQY